jgi:organic hydroperoxide reductase OsmC/OhrA
MKNKDHRYSVHLKWTGAQGSGTQSYTAYSRNHEFTAAGKDVLPGSSDPGFRGDPSRYNPEELLVASISSCHMLWFLHLCAVGGVVIVSYEDDPVAIMQEDETGAGKFVDVLLRPRVVIRHGDITTLERLHTRANEMCFVAQSLNFTVRCEGSAVRES